MFQRPERASSISTKERSIKMTETKEVFQRPERASSISTRKPICRVLEASRFQRPERASSISTVPSGTPHKHWLSSLIFAGICLNILTLTVF